MPKAIQPTTARDAVRDARQIYQAHRDAATRPSKVRNLDKLWEVLEGIRNEGARDYSLAEIGRRLEVVGGPRTQSLRNAQGAHFREIITAYAHGADGSTRHVGTGKSNVDQALDLITDPTIRATLRMAIEEGKRLKVVNDNLHAAFKNLRVGSSLGGAPSHPTDEPSTATSAALPPASTAMAPATVPTLPPRLRAALAKGVDMTRLAQQGLIVGEDGSIQNDVGDRVFPPAFVTAIRVILDTE